LLARTAHRNSDGPFAQLTDTRREVAAETPSVEEKERFVRLTVAAARLDCHPKTLKELVVGGQIAAVRLSPRGHWRISTRSRDEFIESRRR